MADFVRLVAPKWYVEHVVMQRMHPVHIVASWTRTFSVVSNYLSFGTDKFLQPKRAGADQMNAPSPGIEWEGEENTFLLVACRLDGLCTV